MTLEEQKARIRGRHEGNEDAVGLMEVSYSKMYALLWNSISVRNLTLDIR